MMWNGKKLPKEDKSDNLLSFQKKKILSLEKMGRKIVLRWHFTVICILIETFGGTNLLSGVGGSIASVDRFGAYNKLTVKITDQVPRQLCQQTLDTLENLLSSASERFYKITKESHHTTFHGAPLNGTKNNVTENVVSNYFGDIYVILPSSWASQPNCLHNRNIMQSGSKILYNKVKKYHPDFLLEAPHPIFGSEPWSSQFGGCRVQGHGVTVPYTFLTNLQENSEFIENDPTEKVKQRFDAETKLLQEWTRSYFGVFSETGFLDDPMYPEYFDNGLEIKMNQGCNLTTESILPFERKLTYENKNEHFIDIPMNRSWTKFYPKEPFCRTAVEYDRYAPTKQNLLCNGKSVMETLASFVNVGESVTVMDQEYHKLNNQNYSRNQEMEIRKASLNENSNQTFRPPTFHYISQPIASSASSSALSSLYASDKPKYEQPKLVFVLDISQEMAVGDRWMKTRDALFRLIVQLLPVGTELGIVTYGSQFGFGAKVNIQLTMIRESNKQGLHGRIPYRLLSHDLQGCSECGLEVALDVLNVPKEDRYSTRLNQPHKNGGYVDEDTAGEIVLISAKPFPIDASEESVTFQRVQRRIRENGIPLHHIFFDAHPAKASEDLFGNQNGTYYNSRTYATEEGVSLNAGFQNEIERNKRGEPNIEKDNLYKQTQISEFGGVYRVPESIVPSYYVQSSRGSQKKIVTLNSKLMVQKLTGIFLSILKRLGNGGGGRNIECTFKQYFTWDQHLDNELVQFRDNVKLLDVGQTEIRGTFVIESSVSTNLWILLTSPFKEDVEIFELTSPSGQKYSFPKYDHGVVYFNLQRQNNEAGIWSYFVKLHPVIFHELEGNQSNENHDHLISLEVLGASMIPSHLQASQNVDGGISLDFWTHTHVDEKNGVPVVALYAKLTTDDGMLPIHDAEIVATVYIPDPTINKPSRIVLRDDGTGYPDITRYDGIYSAYFTDISAVPGYYSVTIEANSNNGQSKVPKPFGGDDKRIDCCGSVVPDVYSLPTHHFQRFITSESFYLDNIFLQGLYKQDKSDIYPPNRITDLFINYNFNSSKNDPSNIGSLQATLSWTSPGDDFNMGKSAFYEIRCYTNPEVLVDPVQFERKAISVPQHMLPYPLEAGTMQKATVELPWHNEVFYYAIVGVDEAGNRGEVSNLVPIFAEEITTLPSNVSNELGMIFQVIDTENNGEPREAFMDNNTIIYLVAAAIAAFLLILISIFIVAVCRARKRQKLTADDISAPIHPPSSSTLRRQQNPDLSSFSYSQSSTNGNGCHGINGPVSMITTGTDPSLMTGVGSTSLPDVTGLAEHQKSFTANDSSFGYYDVWKYHHNELQPSPVRSEEETTTVDTYIGVNSPIQPMSLGNHMMSSMGHLLSNSIHENGTAFKDYHKQSQMHTINKHQPRSLNMHSASMQNGLQDKAPHSLLMTTTSKYTLNQNSSESPKSGSENPSNTSYNSQVPLSIFRGGRSSSISTDSPQATSSSGGDVSPQNDYFKKQPVLSQNGPASLNWAMANNSPFKPQNSPKKKGNQKVLDKSKKEQRSSNMKGKAKNEPNGGNGSECGTSSTECGSDYSDQNSNTDDKPIVYNVSTSSIVVPNCKNKIPIGLRHSVTRSNNSHSRINIVTPTPAPRTSVSTNSLDFKLGRSKDAKLTSVQESIDEEANWSYLERKKRQESLV